MSSHSDEKPVAGLAEAGYDRSEPQIPSVLFTTFAIIAILVVVGIGVEFYYRTYKDRLIQEIQLDPVSQDLTELRAKEDQQLSSYGVSDREKGQYRLPVSRAMELVINEAKDGKSKYPTAPYIVKKAEDAAAPAAAVPAPAK
jgi:hypothetical protein